MDDPPRKIVLPGGSGYLGRALTDRLVARGDEPVVLTRGPGHERGGVRYVHWDGGSLGEWADELEGRTRSCTWPAAASMCARPVATSTS